MIKTGDFATALCDGRPVGPGPCRSIAFLIDVMGAVTAKYGDDFQPGDVVLTNDPYASMTHMPDIAVVVPAFWKEQLVAFTVSYSHHTDIGGRFPGGFSSQCTESFEEGRRLLIVKLYEGGRRDEALLDTVLANVRMGEEWVGDMEAKIAGCWRGEREVGTLLDKYGLATLNATSDYLIDFSETATRKAIAAIPPGTYVHEDIFEEDGFGSAGVALPLKVTMTADGEGLRFDFTGTARQVPGAINLPISMTRTCVDSAVKSIADPDVLTNAGLGRPIDIHAPEGSLLNPTFPAAVGGRAPQFFRCMDMLSRVLAQALPERVPIPGEGGDVLHLTGKRADGSEYALLDIFFGGWG